MSSASRRLAAVTSTTRGAMVGSSISRMRDTSTRSMPMPVAFMGSIAIGRHDGEHFTHRTMQADENGA